MVLVRMLRLRVRPRTRPPKPKHAADGIPTEYRLVYRNKAAVWPYYTAYVTIATCTCGSLLLFSLSLIGMDLWKYASKDVDRQYDIAHHYTPLLMLVISVLYLIPAIYILRRTLLRIYYNDRLDHFMGIKRGFVMNKIRIPFSAKDCRALADGETYWCNLQIAKQQYHVTARDFSDAEIYNKIMGYERICSKKYR